MAGLSPAATCLPMERLISLAFDVNIDQSSWIALRHFPQLHTNPVNVIVSDRPIRASRQSARWCHDAVEVLWDRRSHLIAEAERPAAESVYQPGEGDLPQNCRGISLSAVR